MNPDPKLRTGTIANCSLWKTQNQILATALIVCGSPPADPRKPVDLIYDEDHPFVPREDDVTKPKYRGEVSFKFLATPEHEALKKAWDEEVNNILQKQGFTELRDTQIGAIRFAAQIFSAYDKVRSPALMGDGIALTIAVWRELQKRGFAPQPNEVEALYIGDIIQEEFVEMARLERMMIEAAKRGESSCVGEKGYASITLTDGAIRFACHVIKGYLDVRQWWEVADPVIRIRHSGEIVTRDDGVKIIPGFIEVSRNAKPATLKHLGIKL